jgi:fumarate reductase iron-sulfur subunit
VIPEQDAEPWWQKFDLPYSDDMSVLQGLLAIKDDFDGSLSFRWTCRMAICGSCGVMVNGKPRLGCKTFLRDYAPAGLRVEALAHFPIERDLVVNIEDFIDKLESMAPYIVPKGLEPWSRAVPQTASWNSSSSTALCINCLLCYAACPRTG